MLLCFPALLLAQIQPAEPRGAVPANNMQRINGPSFEENKGQWPADVFYISSGPGYRVLFMQDRLQLIPTASDAAAGEIELRWVSSNPHAVVSADGRLPYQSNYFLGSNPKEWRISVQHFGEVLYSDVYPGISVAYQSTGQLIEQDIHIESGADANVVRFEVKGATSLSVSEQGDLILKSRDGFFVLAAPRVYQIDQSGNRIPLAGSYLLKGSSVTFMLGAYDHNAKLVIDPVLIYSSYLPTINGIFGFINGIAPGKAILSVDAAGAACVTMASLSMVMMQVEILLSQSPTLYLCRHQSLLGQSSGMRRATATWQDAHSNRGRERPSGPPCPASPNSPPPAL